MAVLVRRVSARGRALLTTAVSTLALVSAALSLALVAAALYSWARHTRLLHRLVVSLYDPVFYNLVLVGVLLLLVSLVAWKLNRNIRLQPTNGCLGRTHWTWLTLAVSASAAVAMTVSTLWGAAEAVDREAAPRYRLAVSRYMDSAAWQGAVDRVQRALHCCGVHGHTDWYSTTWLPVSALPADPASYSKVVQPNGRVLVPVVPTSCCHSQSQSCGHRALLEDKGRSWADLQPADPRNIYTRGCVPAISRLVHIDILVFSSILALIAVLQLVTVVLIRYLYTSTVNSLLLGRPRGSAPGWLFGTEFSFAKGKHRGKHLEEYDQVNEEESSQSTKETEATQDLPDKPKIRSPRDILRSPCLEKLRNKCRKKKQTQHLESGPDSEKEAGSGIPGNKRSKDNIKRMLSRNLIDIENHPSRKHIPRIVTTKPDPIVGVKTSPRSTALDDSQFLSDSKKSPKMVYRLGESQAVPFKIEAATINEPPSIKIEEITVTENNNSTNPGTTIHGGDLDFYTKRTMFENINSGRQPLHESMHQGQTHEVTVAEKSVSRGLPTPKARSDDDSPLFFRNYMYSKS